MAYPRLDRFGNPTNMYTEEELRPGQSPKIEDELIDAFVDNEFILIPEDAAYKDKVSLDAMREMYEFDMSNNKDILGDVTFNDYIESINPDLIKQRAYIDRDLNEPYLGPISDYKKNMKETLPTLKVTAREFGNDFEMVKTSAIRAFDTLNSLRNLPEEMSQTKSSAKKRMLSK
jgi:hypothetical protein